MTPFGTPGYLRNRKNHMTDVIAERSWEDLYPDGICRLSGLIKAVLDQQIVDLPSAAVSDDETRYPVDEPSMRAFLETFFARHVFQLQRSLAEYVASLDFQRCVRFGPLRILDIGSGPAVASLSLIDLVQHTICTGELRASKRPRDFGKVHVLNDTSPICLTTGRRMLATCRELGESLGLMSSGDRVLTLLTAFPHNIRQIQQLASSLGGFDIIILSYVMSSLTEAYGLRSLGTAVRALERLCKPCGRVVVLQDRFQESLIRSLAKMSEVEHREQTVTQEIYPPRGDNETYTYTYYDCLYAPRMRVIDRVWRGT